MGKLGVGGTEKGKEERSRVLTSRLLRVATKNCPPYVRMYLGESSLSFFSVAALQAVPQPADRFLTVRFLFVLVKMWHLESFQKERSQQFSGGLSSARTRQGEANAEPSRGQITATFSHAELGSAVGCRGRFMKFFPVLCKVCVQNRT